MFVCFGFLDTFIIVLAQRVESTGTGGDRSINSSYSRWLLTSSSLLKNEKKKKKRKLKVIGGEGDENENVKIIEKWLCKLKEDETKMN